MFGLVKRRAFVLVNVTLSIQLWYMYIYRKGNEKTRSLSTLWIWSVGWGTIASEIELYYVSIPYNQLLYFFLQINVRIPKLSPRADDWLARPSSISITSDSSPKFSMPTLSNKTDDWLYKSAGSKSSVCSTTDSVSSIMSGHVASLTSSSSVPSLTSMGTFSSTQSWLKQIKQDQEDEDDFEIVETAGSTGRCPKCQKNQLAPILLKWILN